MQSKAKMFVNSDLSDLLQLFSDNKVRYLVIAVRIHPVCRTTLHQYLHLLISTDMDKASAVFRSLKEFGAPLVDLSEDDFAEQGYFYQMSASPVRVDILMGIPGVGFEEAWDRRMEVDFDGLSPYRLSQNRI